MKLRAALRSACRIAGAASVSCALAIPSVLLTSPAQAGFFSSTPGVATQMVEGGHRAGPKAYFRMCKREPGLCANDQHRSDQPQVAMTKPLWQTVISVNESLNDQIRERDDLSLFGQSDFWTLGRRYGDCEDYIIAKKQALIAHGIAPENLLYAVIRNRWDRGYHAVLILRTTDGDYVLDNLRDRILPWEDSDYDFIMRQAAGEPMAWVSVGRRGVQPVAVSMTAKRTSGATAEDSLVARLGQPPEGR